jgi:hypothetical protein
MTASSGVIPPAAPPCEGLSNTAGGLGVWSFIHLIVIAGFDAMREGEIIEVYGADRPYPSCLILRLGAQPLHVVAAIDAEAHICHVITAYRPDLDRFEPGFRERRKR